MPSNPSYPSCPSYRKTAIVVGILFIVCTAASILSALPTLALLDAPDYLTQLAAHDDRVVLGAILEFIWAVSGAGIAVALYPVLRRHNRGLALGAVGCRIVENVFVLVSALGLLVLLTLGQQSVTGGSLDPSSLQASGALLLGVRDWAAGFVGYIPFLLGAGMYYYVMYRARLVPRWLSGCGIVAVVLSMVATIYSGLTQDFGFATLNSVLNAPIAAQEMVLAVWLIVKGFNRSAPAPAPAPAPALAPSPVAQA